MQKYKKCLDIFDNYYGKKSYMNSKIHHNIANLYSEQYDID